MKGGNVATFIAIALADTGPSAAYTVDTTTPTVLSARYEPN